MKISETDLFELLCKCVWTSKHEHSQGKPQKKPASVIDNYESTRMLKELLDQKESSESSAKALVNLISLEFIYF